MTEGGSGEAPSGSRKNFQRRQRKKKQKTEPGSARSPERQARSASPPPAAADRAPSPANGARPRLPSPPARRVTFRPEATHVEVDPEAPVARSPAAEDAPREKPPWLLKVEAARAKKLHDRPNRKGRGKGKRSPPRQDQTGASPPRRKKSLKKPTGN